MYVDGSDLNKNIFNTKTMDSTSTQLCRLCLETSENLVNIFESFQDSTIASILTQHFWFQIHKNDVSSEWICETCWINTKMFHIFYQRLKLLHANYWKSIIKSIGDDLIKQERSDSPKDATLESDVEIVFKCEETEPPLEVNEIQECFDYNDDQSEIARASDDDGGDESSNEKPKNDDVDDDIRRKNYSKFERDKQDVQIREFFTMQCEICNDVKFETIINARQHYREVHNKSGYLICCGKKHHRRYRLLEHIVEHTNPNAYRCDPCGKTFVCKRSLRKHIELHVPVKSRALAHKCSLCSKCFANASTLKYHIERKHPKKDEAIPCDKCNKSFRSRILLTTHIQGVHNSLSFVCDVCARQFKTKQMLLSHTTNEHSTTPQPKVQCNICGAWLKNEKGLRKHLLLHQDNNSRVVNCSICNKECRDKHRLSNHTKYAHGEKNHQCLMCDKAFKIAKNLKEHIAIHTGEYLYNCRYCEKKFKSNANMYSHRKKAHLAEWTRDYPHQQRTKVEKESTK